jgi:hypothetical protein
MSLRSQYQHVPATAPAPTLRVRSANRRCMGIWPPPESGPYLPTMPSGGTSAERDSSNPYLVRHLAPLIGTSLTAGRQSNWMKTHSNAKAAGRRAGDLRLLWWPPRGVEPPTFGSSVAPTKWPRKHSLDGGRPGDTCGDTCPSKNHYQPRRCTDGCLGQSARRSRSNGGASHSVGLRFEPDGPPNTTMVAMPSRLVPSHPAQHQYRSEVPQHHHRDLPSSKAV